MEDNAIIELYFARNEAAIAETEKKYSGYCGTVARNILNKREDEEECLNDTWLSAWNDIPPSRPRVFRAYLGRITRNLSLNILRRRGAGKRGGLEVIFGELDEALPAADSVERELDGRELPCAVPDGKILCSALSMSISGVSAPENATVEITDRAGNSVNIISNDLDNILFETPQSPMSIASVKVDEIEMLKAK